MAKGLIGRHLNDYSPVLNMEGVWHRPQGETLWNDYCSWQVDDKSRSLFLSVNLCIQCQCMDVQCVLCINLFVCLLPRVFFGMCKCVCDVVGRHAYKPSGVPYSELCHHKAEMIYIRQITALPPWQHLMEKNKTPFNEDANLRNIALCSEI